MLNKNVTRVMFNKNVQNIFIHLNCKKVIKVRWWCFFFFFFYLELTSIKLFIYF